MEGGHGDLPGQVPGRVVGGGEDDPPLGGGEPLYISPTPALLAAVLTTVTVL